jgi:hypothetical protein
MILKALFALLLVLAGIGANAQPASAINPFTGAAETATSSAEPQTERTQAISPPASAATAAPAAAAARGVAGSAAQTTARLANRKKPKGPPPEHSAPQKEVAEASTVELVAVIRTGRQAAAVFRPADHASFVTSQPADGADLRAAELDGMPYRMRDDRPNRFIASDIRSLPAQAVPPLRAHRH